jgi:hypothetical protein
MGFIRAGETEAASFCTLAFSLVLEEQEEKTNKRQIAKNIKLIFI